MGVFQELKRRNVFRVGIAYIILSWLLLQVTDVVAPILELPGWVAKFVLFLLALGLPLVLFFAWAYELTPDGLKREEDVDRSRSITPNTGKTLDRAIIAILAAAVTMLLVDRFWLDRGATEPAPETQAVADSRIEKSVAVLPFIAMSSGADDEYFADGLTEEILNSLAQLPELLVTARTSAFFFKGKELPPVAEIAAKLGVKHIVEGSVRRSGERLRVTAQLIRAADGFHLWSQNYDSSLTDTIVVQEEIAEQIAVALDIVLDDDKREAMRRAGLRDVAAFTEFQKGEDLYVRAHGDLDQISTLRRANEHFAAVLERVPDFGGAHLRRSDLYIHILVNDITGTPNPGVSPAEVDIALQNAIDEYSAAVRSARNPTDREAWEFDVAAISGNWRGLGDRAERLLDGSGCITVNWLAPFAIVFGMAESFLRRMDDIIACDPLYSISWLNRSRAALWSGNPELAVAHAERGLEIAPNSWNAISLVKALAQMGRYDEAESVVDTRITRSEDAAVIRLMVMAASGDADKAATALEDYRRNANRTGFYDFLAAVWTGDRDAANAMAARIDAHPFRHHALTLYAYWCACGAPFDLDVTPKYAASLDEAGLPWPPASPIEFPLKDW